MNGVSFKISAVHLVALYFLLGMEEEEEVKCFPPSP
jgi:hypothetical protein